MSTCLCGCEMEANPGRTYLKGHNRRRRPGVEYDDNYRPWRFYDPAKNRANKMRYKYGISAEDYDLMYAEQGGKCAICGRTADEVEARYKRLVVDHDHDTDAVRGLLCASCNSAIGLLQDDPEVAMAAAAYLLQHAPSSALKGGN